MLRWVPALLIVTACGGSPTAPSQAPAPTTAATPAPAPIIAPDPSRFDAAFNAQLVHDAYEHPDARQPARLLTANPSIYLQRVGLSDSTVAALKAAAEAVVPALSGGRLTVAAFETGTDVRPDSNGWIVVELVNDTTQKCGLTKIGAVAGHSWLNIATRCQFHGLQIDPPLFAHEVGHALGFFHVADPGHLMHPPAVFGEYASVLPSDQERYHAGLAYQTNGAYAAR